MFRRGLLLVASSLLISALAQAEITGVTTRPGGNDGDIQVNQHGRFAGVSPSSFTIGGGTSSLTLGGTTYALQINGGGVLIGTGTLTMNTTANLLTVGANTLFSNVTTTQWTNISSMTFDSGTTLAFSSSAVLRAPASSTPNPACTSNSQRGQIYIDTNAPSGQQIYACEGASGWILQGGTGGSAVYSATSTAGFPYGFAASTGSFTAGVIAASFTASGSGVGVLTLKDSDGSNFISLEASGTINTDMAYVLPSSSGTVGQVLSINGLDGNGKISTKWAAAADPNAAVLTATQTFSGTNTFAQTTNFTGVSSTSFNSVSSVTFNNVWVIVPTGSTTSITSPIIANGSYGTAGQVLTSNGSGLSVSWATGSGGGGVGSSVAASYGAMYLSSGAITVTNISTTPIKLSIFLSSGISQNTTVSTTNASITVSTAGVYNVFGHAHAVQTVGGAISEKYFYICVNGSTTSITGKNYAGSNEPLSISGDLNLNVNDVVTACMATSSTTPGVGVQFINAQLLVNAIGGSGSATIGTGSGGIDSGTIGQMAYYAVNGTTVSGTSNLINNTSSITINAETNFQGVSTMTFNNSALLMQSGSTLTVNGLLQVDGSSSFRNGAETISPYGSFSTLIALSTDVYLNWGTSPGVYPLSFQNTNSNAFNGNLLGIGNSGGPAALFVSTGITAGVTITNNDPRGKALAVNGSSVFTGTVSVTGFINTSTDGAHPVPSLSSCGTSPSLSVGATDTSGKITVGGGVVTSCTLTFGIAKGKAPSCTMLSDTAITSPTGTTNTTTFVIGGGATFAGDVIMYNCFGND